MRNREHYLKVPGKAKHNSHKPKESHGQGLRRQEWAPCLDPLPWSLCGRCGLSRNIQTGECCGIWTKQCYKRLWEELDSEVEMISQLGVDKRELIYLLELKVKWQKLRKASWVFFGFSVSSVNTYYAPTMCPTEWPWEIQKDQSSSLKLLTQFNPWISAINPGFPERWNQ